MLESIDTLLNGLKSQSMINAHESDKYVEVRPANIGGQWGVGSSIDPITKNIIVHQWEIGGTGGRGEIQINGVNLTYEEASKLGLLKESTTPKN